MNANTQPILSEVAESNRLGALLVRSGKLSNTDLDKIAKRQRKTGTRFGEAAIALRLVSEADIVQAVSQQFNFTCLDKGSSPVSESIIAAYQPLSDAVEQLRQLRSFLVQKLDSNTPATKVFSFVSVNDNEGRSWTVANLGVLFSQLGKRTVLFDCNLRTPAQAGLFGIETHSNSGLSALLAKGGAKVEQHKPIPGLDLSIITAGFAPPNPQELLGQDRFAGLIRQAAENYDVVLIDCAAGQFGADSLITSTLAGGAVLTQRRNISQVESTRAYCEVLNRSGVALYGSVLCDG